MRTLLFLSLVVVLSGCSVFGIRSEETPKYKVIQKSGDSEVRNYEPYIVARTYEKGDYKAASRRAFRRLAGYIFGRSLSTRKISA